MNITNGKTADNKGPYDVPLHKASVIVANRFYNDFSLLNVWISKGVFFVMRHKENLQFKSIEEFTRLEKRQQHILKDELIELTTPASIKKYGNKLRRVANSEINVSSNFRNSTKFW